MSARERAVFALRMILASLVDRLYFRRYCRRGFPDEFDRVDRLLSRLANKLDPVDWDETIVLLLEDSTIAEIARNN